MIKDFSDWLFEGNKEESALFVELVKKALADKGLKANTTRRSGEGYDISSSNAQLNHGTLQIEIQSKNILEEALIEWGINSADMSKDAYEDYLLYGSKGSGGKLMIYSRGGVRPWKGTSDSLKFKPDAEGVEKLANWVVDWYKGNAISFCTSLLKPEKFQVRKKGKPVNVDDVEEFMTPALARKLDSIKETSPETFNELSPEIMFMVFLAKIYKGKVGAITTNEYVLGTDILVEKGKVEFTSDARWKVSKKHKTLQNMLDTSWRGRVTDGRFVHGMDEIFEYDLLPMRFKDIYKAIKKGNYDLDSFVEKSRGYMTARKFGL